MNYEIRNNSLDAIILRDLNRNNSICHSRALSCHSRRYKLGLSWIVIFVTHDNYSKEKKFPMDHTVPEHRQIEYLINRQFTQ